MAQRILKIKGTEIACGTANTVSNATLVRCFANQAGPSVITLTTGTIANGDQRGYANSTIYANCTVAGLSETILSKWSTDTVQGTNILATNIAFTD